MSKYDDLPTRALIYQHSETKHPWAVEVERLSQKKPKQVFEFRVYSDALPHISTDWIRIENADLQTAVSSICNCLKTLQSVNSKISSCSDDYAHIHWQMEKFFYTWC